MSKALFVWCGMARRSMQAGIKKLRASMHLRVNVFLLLFLIGSTAALPVNQAAAATPPDWESQSWVGTWATAPTGPPAPDQTPYFDNQTLRLIVHSSIGGSFVRIRLSNEFGVSPLHIGSAHIGVRQSGAVISAATDRKLSFGGTASIAIPAGAVVISDPVELRVPALSDLAVSIYLPFSTPAATVHDAAFQTSFVSAPGDYSATPAMPVERTISSWPFLTGVDVIGSGLGGSIVMVGDSLTDGHYSALDSSSRWPDMLAVRLQSARLSINPLGSTLSRILPGLSSNTNMLGVLNKGIGGNRLLRDLDEFPLYGKNLLARFNRDVISQAGVQYLIVLIGINDLGFPGTGATPLSEAVTVETMKAGYRQLIQLAHDHGISVFGGTITPFEGVPPNYYSAQKEQVRQAINQWIRTGKAFDGVVDFDAAVRDPAQPSRLRPAYDSGDHLHLNNAGMRAMANAVPLQLFRDNGFAHLRSLSGR